MTLRERMSGVLQGGKTGRLWLRISEDPPAGQWQKSLPQIVKAIRDFGPV